MNRFLAIALVALMTAFAVGTAESQVRVPNYASGVGAPKVTPKAAPRQGVKVAPNVPRLPPSVALKRAMRQVPGAQALSVRPNGNVYVVKLKKGGNIIQLNVNSATGAISRLP